MMNALLTASLGIILVYVMTKGLMTAYDSQSKISGVGQVDTLNASLNLMLSEAALCKNAFRSSNGTPYINYTPGGGTYAVNVPQLWVGDVKVADVDEDLGNNLVIEAIKLRDSGIPSDTVTDFEDQERTRYFATLDVKVRVKKEKAPIELTPVRLSVLTDATGNLVGCSTDPDLM